MGEAVYQRTASSILSELGTNTSKGLTSTEAANRLQQFGKNEIQKPSRIKAWIMFLQQFKGFIIYILLFALLISILLGEYTDAITILVVLIINAFFGFIQEYRAEKAIEALQRMASVKARVIRNGELIEIDACDVVVGDIVQLEEGDKVPADGRIISLTGLQVLESSLTGESSAVTKISDVLKGNLVINDQKNMVFSSTMVTKGRGVIVVTSIGMQTEIGKIAHLLQDVEKEETPLQQKLDSFGKFIGYAVLAISTLIFLVGMFRAHLFDELFSGDYLGFIKGAKDWLLTAIALAVAAVPEGLPAIVTISLAIGVRKMLKRRALIRRLPSVETLGETSVICSDKTGTITNNEMTVRRMFVEGVDCIVSGEGYDTRGVIDTKGKNIAHMQEILLTIGAICNNSELRHTEQGIEITGDPTEAALLVSAQKGGINYRDLKNTIPRIDEVPFDSQRKMMTTVHARGKKIEVYTKGAPERVLDVCDRILVKGRVVRMNKDLKEKILEQNVLYAEDALRVLGFAYKEISKKGGDYESGLIFVGLQAMIDPPKKEIKPYLVKCLQAGIRVVMVTGDNIHTAKAIAREIGLTGESIEGSHFAQMGDIEKQKIIATTNVFARVEPSHKLEIVRLLQQRGEVVAMTGDGVNDAPALKQADIGIAMGIKGTDVAKESSDMVLLDDNFATIVDTVEEGRGIYENIRKFVNYLLSCNLAEVMIVFFAMLFSLPLPMTAIMLLWLNLVTDGLPALALGVDPYPANSMQRPPRRKQEPLMNGSLIFNIISVAILITVSVLGIFIWALKTGNFSTLEARTTYAQTLSFTTLILLELVRVYAIRADYKLPIFSNMWLVLALASSFALQVIVLYTPLGVFFGTVPLSLLDWEIMTIVCTGVFLLSMGLSVVRKKIFETERKL